MQNVPIKFRGKDIETGEFVYAELGNVFSVINSRYTFITDDGYTFVNADSVVQLVGYDADGKEVYEGDIVVSIRGSEYQASLDGIITKSDNSWLRRYLKNLDHRKYFRLKGNDND